MGLGAAALGKYWLVPPGPSGTLESTEELLRALHASLDAGQRAEACFPYDYPARQLHNRGVRGPGANVWPNGLSYSQRRTVTDLVHAGLSATGRERIPAQYFFSFAGVHHGSIALFGDPEDPPFHAVIYGAHLNLRLGIGEGEGVVFGGPQVYGDQRGDGVAGLPGNVYLPQYERAMALLAGLGPGARERCLAGEPPPQTAIAVRGSGAGLDGVPVGELDGAGRRRAEELVRDTLSTWAGGDGAVAAIEDAGGIGALHFACYDEGAVPERGLFPVFRFECANAVLHFRGHPSPPRLRPRGRGRGPGPSPSDPSSASARR